MLNESLMNKKTILREIIQFIYDFRTELIIDYETKAEMQTRLNAIHQAIEISLENRPTKDLFEKNPESKSLEEIAELISSEDFVFKGIHNDEDLFNYLTSKEKDEELDLQFFGIFASFFQYLAISNETEILMNVTNIWKDFCVLADSIEKSKGIHPAIEELFTEFLVIAKNQLIDTFKNIRSKTIESKRKF
jgi:hypothetical protein